MYKSMCRVVDQPTLELKLVYAYTEFDFSFLKQLHSYVLITRSDVIGLFKNAMPTTLPLITNVFCSR